MAINIITIVITITTTINPPSFESQANLLHVFHQFLVFLLRLRQLPPVFVQHAFPLSQEFLRCGIFHAVGFFVAFASVAPPKVKFFRSSLVMWGKWNWWDGKIVIDISNIKKNQEYGEWTCEQLGFELLMEWHQSKSLSHLITDTLSCACFSDTCMYCMCVCVRASTFCMYVRKEQTSCRTLRFPNLALKSLGLLLLFLLATLFGLDVDFVTVFNKGKAMFYVKLKQTIWISII